MEILALKGLNNCAEDIKVEDYFTICTLWILIEFLICAKISIRSNKDTNIQ